MLKFKNSIYINLLLGLKLNISKQIFKNQQTNYHFLINL